jgi:hypothetical protein
MTLLLSQTIIIVVCVTIYFIKLTAVKELYFVWICVVLFCNSGLFIGTPTLIAKGFGQKNFVAIYGTISLISVIFLRNLFKIY